MKDSLGRHGSTARGLLLLASVAGAISCGDDQSSVTTDGTIEIVTVTEGVDFDENGYLWSVNGSLGQAIGHQQTVFVEALEAGDYVVSLSDIAENCSVPDNDNPQEVAVVPGETTDVLFEITCNLIDPGGGGNVP